MVSDAWFSVLPSGNRNVLSSIWRKTVKIIAKRNRMRPRRRTEAMMSSPKMAAYSAWVVEKYSLNWRCWSRWSVNRMG